MSEFEGEVLIRCTQLSPIIGDFAGNVEKITEEIRQAVQDQIHLLVLPELATSGYVLTPAEAKAAAIDRNHEVFTIWKALLKNSMTTVVLGFCEFEVETIFNSAALITSEEGPVFYRKLHLWDAEKMVFEPGNVAPPVVRTPFGKVGFFICYDLEFPELPRSMALRGADIIAVPTNWPLRDQPAGERPPEVVHAMAAAQASSVAIACADRAGAERGIEWTEGTTVIGPDGYPVKEKVNDKNRLDATVVLLSNRRQVSARNDLFGDRRPEFYQ